MKKLIIGGLCLLASLPAFSEREMVDFAKIPLCEGSNIIDLNEKYHGVYYDRKGVPVMSLDSHGVDLFATTYLDAYEFKYACKKQRIIGSRFVINIISKGYEFKAKYKLVIKLKDNNSIKIGQKRRINVGTFFNGASLGGGSATPTWELRKSWDGVRI